MKKPKREQVRMAGAVAALVCAFLVFTGVFSAYARRFDRTLMEENRSRLEEVSGHVAAYIERAVEGQWNELQVVTAALAEIGDEAAQVEYLGRMAQALEFAYIGLAGEDGTLRAAAFHKPQDISGEDYFQAASGGEAFMTGPRRQIFWDRAVSGVVLALPAPGGRGVVAALLPMAKLGQDAQVDSFDGNGFSYIIDGAGEQVLHARSMAYNNLFQAMENVTFAKGYTLAGMRADIEGRRAGMTAYADLGVEKYAYYRPLNVGDWTVISIVPKGVVTARTSMLSRELIWMCVVAALVFLSLLSTVGVLVLRLESRRRANRAKSQFLANMSHDMRTPMNAIMGMAAIARSHADEPDTVRDCMRKIGFSSKHLLGLINDVLDMSRIESGKMTLAQEPFSLGQVLESVENMTYPRIHAKDQHFSVRLHGVRHEYFCGDSLRLGQVFVNLLTNATKFTPEGGCISVDVEELAEQGPDTARFRFVFTDNGIGMDPAFLKELFTPFVRERNSRVDSTEGSGLGMSITKHIVELMGGQITVQSTAGAGSVFTVTLPLRLDAGAPGELPLPAWRVLLVGGHREEQQEVLQTLADMGQQADWAPSPQDAARYLAQKAYQAVFVDRGVYEPQALAQLFRQGAPAAFLLTAYDWEDIRAQAAAAGVGYFVQKPLLRTTLCAALRKAAGMEDAQGQPAVPCVDLTGKKLLLAEDNELNLEIASTVLAEAGASLCCARDGKECLALFESSPVGGFDLILMDIQMPRMDGCEAARRIRALARADAAVPILAMSANAYAEDIAAASAAGMNGYLLKPIDLPAWLAEIKKCLAG